MATAAVATASWGRARWKRGSGLAAAPGPMNPAGNDIDGGTGDVIGLKVELFIASAWVDVSPYVYYKHRVKITRGRPNETSATQPQTCTFTLDNRDGRFSPRNPVGPYYGQIGRNTPVRVSRLANGIRRYRFYGEIPAWPMVSDISGTEVTVTIGAAGMLRRLTQGTASLRSALFRAYTLGYNSNQFGNYTAPTRPVTYWPCEDGTTSTSIASGLPGGQPLVLSGQAAPTFASNSVFACSAPLPLLSASIWTGTIPAYTGGTANVMRFLMSVPVTGAFDTGVIARMYTTGTIARFDVVYSALSGGSLVMNCYDAAANLLMTATLTITVGAVTGINNVPIIVSAEVTTVGSSVQGLLEAVAISNPSSIFGAGSNVPGGAGSATKIVISPDGHFNDTAIGHITYQSAFDSLVTIQPAVTAYNFDSPIIRFSRLCGEQNVPAVNLFVASNALLGTDPTVMGVQPIDTFPNLIQQCADALYVPIFETRDQLSLAMRSKGTMYNQAAKLTLDMSAHQLSGPLVPVDDDALTRNDVAVSAINGSSATVTQAASPLSVAPFPAGVGDYSTNYSLNLASGVSLSDQAGWRMRFGTVDEPRYPQVPINLRYPTFTSNVDMMNAALTIDIGDRLAIINPPAPDYPPDPISLILQGYSETLGIYEHDMVLNCSPESPWRVGFLDDPVLGHADTDGSTLALPAAATDTTMSVATANVASPRWTTSAADFPFDVNVGGERIRVTSITSPPTIAGADGTFEAGIGGWNPSWSPTAGTWAASSAQAHTGAQSGLITTSSGLSIMSVATPFFPVTPSTSYTFSFWALQQSGSHSVFGRVDWYDATRTLITLGTASGTFGPAVWAQSSVTSTSPANAAYGIARVLDNIGTAGGLYIDDITVTPPPDPQLFTVTRAVNGPGIPLGADGTFETGIANWTPQGGTFVATGVAHAGNQAGLLTAAGSPSQTYVRPPNIPVTPGGTYSLSQWVLTASGAPTVIAAIDTFDSGGGYLSTYASPTVTAPGVWTNQSFTAAIDHNAAFVAVGPSMLSSPPNGTAIYVDDIVLTGVMKAQTAGTDVRLWQPMYLSL